MVLKSFYERNEVDINIAAILPTHQIYGMLET